MDDRQREEEALAGLAIAEATKLWSYCQRPHDKYGRREACEVAAGTAERLFRRSRRREREGYDYDDNMSVLGGDYSSSDDSESRRRRRARRRRRSSVGLGYPGAQLIPSAGTSGYMQGGYPMSPHLGGNLNMPGVNYAPAQPYVTQYPNAQQAAYSPNFSGGLAVPQVGRPRASSFGYPPPSPTYY